MLYTGECVSLLKQTQLRNLADCSYEVNKQRILSCTLIAHEIMCIHVYTCITLFMLHTHSHCYIIDIPCTGSKHTTEDLFKTVHHTKWMGLQVLCMDDITKSFIQHTVITCNIVRMYPQFEATSMHPQDGILYWSSHFKM